MTTTPKHSVRTELIRACVSLDVEAMMAGNDEGRLGTSLIIHILNGGTIDTYDETEQVLERQTTDLREGDHVFHPTYGNGIVGNDIDDPNVLVVFTINEPDGGPSASPFLASDGWELA